MKYIPVIPVLPPLTVCIMIITALLTGCTPNMRCAAAAERQVEELIKLNQTLTRIADEPRP
jgi:hypothetical protein